MTILEFLKWLFIDYTEGWFILFIVALTMLCYMNWFIKKVSRFKIILLIVLVILLIISILGMKL